MLKTLRKTWDDNMINRQMTLQSLSLGDFSSLWRKMGKKNCIIALLPFYFADNELAFNEIWRGGPLRIHIYGMCVGQIWGEECANQVLTPFLSSA